MTREEQITLSIPEHYSDNDAVYYTLGAEWADKHPQNLWHDAQSDDLPEIDREVIVLCENSKVCFGHRPNPDGWDGRNILTDEINHYTPQTYNKGGWNIPDVKWWLDVELPNMEE